MLLLQPWLHAYMSLLDLSNITWSTAGIKESSAALCFSPAKSPPGCCHFHLADGNWRREKLSHYCGTKKCTFFLVDRRGSGRAFQYQVRGKPFWGTSGTATKLFLQAPHLPLRDLLTQQEVEKYSCSAAALPLCPPTCFLRVRTEQIKWSPPALPVQCAPLQGVDGWTHRDGAGQAKLLGM